MDDGQAAGDANVTKALDALAVKWKQEHEKDTRTHTTSPHPYLPHVSCLISLANPLSILSWPNMKRYLKPGSDLLMLSLSARTPFKAFFSAC
jgi:hypothetical protein